MTCCGEKCLKQEKGHLFHPQDVPVDAGTSETESRPELFDGISEAKSSFES